MADHEDELAASKTAGFKVGEKKTLEEYQQLGGLPIMFTEDFRQSICHKSASQMIILDLVY